MYAGVYCALVVYGVSLRQGNCPRLETQMLSLTTCLPHPGFPKRHHASSPSDSIHLIHPTASTRRRLVLLDEDANEAGLEHVFVVDPRMHFPK